VPNNRTVRAILESLQVIQSTAEHLAESGGSATSAAKVTREVKKIVVLVGRLEVELSCPIEKICSCTRGNKKRA